MGSAQQEKELRRRQSDAKKKLWSSLQYKRLDGLKFRKEQPMGKYIVNFVSFYAKLIIEIDTSQYNDSQQMEKDEVRNIWLVSQGFRVIRFSINEVLSNTEGVLTRIQEELGIE
jgi:very-short-patch-repair endonuclease